MASDAPWLRLGSRSAEVRRELGPVAWLVLEELFITEQQRIAATSIRVLGARLGLAKDTVAAALRRLVDRGFLERTAQRRSASGRFSVGGYRLNAHELAEVLAIGATGRRAPSVDKVQARLFDVGADR